MFNNLKIKNMLKKAEYFFDNSTYDKSLFYCNKILILDSKNIRALYIKSEILYIKSQYSSSLEILDGILNICNEYDQALLLKGRIYLELDRFDEGFKFYEKFLKNNSDFSLFFNEISYFSFFEDKSKKNAALDLCNLYLEKYDSYEIKVWKSQLLFRLNLFEDALFTLENLINYKGDDEYLYLIKCNVLLKLGKYDEVLDFSEKSFKLYNNYGFLYDNAEALFSLEEYGSSIEICKKILNSQNKIYHNCAKFLMAKIYFAKENYEKSLIEINNAILLLRSIVGEDYPLNEYVNSFNQYYFFKSEILLELNELNDASKIIDCLLEKDESAKNYCLKAKILYEMDDYENALMFVNKALDLKPDCREAIQLKENLINSS